MRMRRKKEGSCGIEGKRKDGRLEAQPIDHSRAKYIIAIRTHTRTYGQKKRKKIKKRAKVLFRMSVYRTSEKTSRETTAWNAIT